MHNCYNILGVNRDASKEEIIQRYKKLAHIHHPDKGGDKKMFILVNKAYKEAIKNLNLNINYSSSLLNKQTIIKFFGFAISLIVFTLIFNALSKRQK